MKIARVVRMSPGQGNTIADHDAASGSGASAAGHASRGRRKCCGNQRILFHHGSWWFADVWADRLVRLDPLFAACGWNVGRMCETLGLGKRTFGRVVEQSLGITGKIWLRNLRVVAACHMLREGTKIETTARKLGFRHSSDFTREFRILIGVLPSFYVKAERSRSVAPWELA